MDANTDLCGIERGKAYINEKEPDGADITRLPGRGIARDILSSRGAGGMVDVAMAHLLRLNHLLHSGVIYYVFRNPVKASLGERRSQDKLTV